MFRQQLLDIQSNPVPRRCDLLMAVQDINEAAKSVHALFVQPLDGIRQRPVLWEHAPSLECDAERGRYIAQST